MENEKDTEMKGVIVDNGVSNAVAADAGDGEDEEDEVVVMEMEMEAVTAVAAELRARSQWIESKAILGRLVSNFRARNWSLVARGIPGRSGKSCLLRWCNQLDPAVKRKPFTDEEDSIILQAHAIHGNKWASVAWVLRERTDNAIKNHWNSKLRRHCIESGKFKFDSSNVMEDNSAEKSKASSDETLSCADVHSFKCQEKMDDELHENRTHIDCQCTSEAKDPPSFCRPTAQISARSVYGSLDVMETSLPVGRLANFEGPLDQLSKPDIWISKLLQKAYGDRLVPHECGHCCIASPGIGE